MKGLAFLGLPAALAAFVAATCCEPAPVVPAGTWPRTDFSRRTVDLAEFRTEGPARDAAPALTAPGLVPAAEARSAMSPLSPVLAVETGGEARAYPLALLLWHRLVNDRLGDVPVLIAYCPLCNAGMAFERRIGSEELTFGSSGLLHRDDLVIYDVETESWWQQTAGQALVGALAGARLARLPSHVETLAEFAARRPDGLVLAAPPAGAGSAASPLGPPDAGAMPFHYDGSYDGPGSPLMRVVMVDGRREGWSLAFLREAVRVEAGRHVIEWRVAPDPETPALAVQDGPETGHVVVHRRSGGASVPEPFHMPYAFVFRRLRPDAPIHHVERGGRTRPSPDGARSLP